MDACALCRPCSKGFFPKSELYHFCESDAMLGPSQLGKTPGVEASTGSLGHGLSIGIGIALNARIDHKTTEHMSCLVTENAMRAQYGRLRCQQENISSETYSAC